MFEAYTALPIPLPGDGYPFAEAVDSGEALVDITDRHRQLVYLASYARQGYSGAPTRLWVRDQVAQRLIALANSLPPSMALAVFDALRPLSVQQELFDRYLKQLAREHPQWSREELHRQTCRFVAEPRTDRPSNHLTGGAVDLTLYQNGQPLPMGTGFDDFTDKALTRYYEDRPLTEQEAVFCRNRRLLYHLMAGQGFTNYQEEWWHYDFGDTTWAQITGKKPMYGLAPTPKQAY
jgi:D-alanyl-D-alanine dipeptidase